MKKNIKLYLFIFLTVFSATSLYTIYKNKYRTVKAFGNLLVDLGVPSGDPIFTDNDFKPGQCRRHTFSILNNNNVNAEPSVKILLTSDSSNLSQMLQFTLTSQDQTLYTGPLSNDFITLPPLPPSVKTFYEISICMKPEANNDYQNTQVIFNLTFGEELNLHPTLPPECQSLEGLITHVIENTNKKILIGTKASELIIGSDNTEIIKGRGGNDCLVAGKNTERMYGNSGNDVLIGNNLDNKFYGSLGQDKIFGLGGNDKLYGGIGNDYLHGGADYDKLYGQTGLDTCIEGEKLYSCEY